MHPGTVNLFSILILMLIVREVLQDFKVRGISGSNARYKDGIILITYCLENEFVNRFGRGGEEFASNLKAIARIKEQD